MEVRFFSLLKEKMGKNHTSSLFLLPSSFQKGSALLIVLGMLSFMVVSAVGFSIYMRSGRMPSSYLRRNLAARNLVKSALARAVDELDGVWYSAGDGLVENDGFVGIYDDPYPGCLPQNDSGYGNPKRNGDQWLNRVFMPLGALEEDETSDTVPTLTFEALAYLPPAIIDDVRMLARRTRTALWHPLPYDSGRYAYCAVNVSDLFDINRLRANKARNSSANGRVTLASLCCTSYDDPMSVSTANASELDSILDRAKSLGKANGNATPFTSLADFNFVAGPNCEWAPFFDYVGKSGNANMLKSGSAKSANAMFITDTWFPTTNNVAGTDFDLESPSAQPFRDLQSANSFLDVDIASVLNKVAAPGHTVAAGTIFEKNLGIGLVCLHDYLDRDNLPLSLALPTTEIVPMVVGVSSPAGLAPQLGEIGAPQNAKVNGITGEYISKNSQGGSTPVTAIVADRKYTLYGITSFGNRAIVKVVLVSPFKRLKTTNRAKSYTLRGLLRVWAAPNGMGCRPSDASGNLYPVQSAWNGSSSVANGVATFVCDSPQTISAFPDVNKAEEATVEATLTFSSLNVSMPLYYKVEEVVNQSDSAAATGLGPGTYTAPKSEVNPSYKSFGDIKNKTDAFRPLTVQGEVDQEWKKQTFAAQFQPTVKFSSGGMTEFNPASIATTYRLYASLWIQVMDGNEVVDMVPAGVKDDVEWLGVNIPGNNAVSRILGGDTPLMNFKGDTDITFATIEAQLPQALNNFDGWKSLYAVDPRFNFAPEDWFGSSANAVATKGEWIQLLGLDGNTSPILGQNGRDRDIFMFVSDQEYLQSIGELQFLPYLQDMDGSANFLTGYAPNFHGKAWDADNRTGPVNGTFANGGRFWRTYTAYNNGNGYDPIYSLPYGGKEYVFESGRGGFKLNPYSSDQRVVFAGLIGTPFDYYMASTNTVVNTMVSSLTLNDMMSKYSFSKSVSCAKIGDDEMTGLADNLIDAFRNSARQGKTNWLDCWDSLDWQQVNTQKINNDNNILFGVTLQNPLHGVDRKYLYSFWRECFANRQQLFLVFVRAEPAVASVGGINDRSSSQMGGRAVALVWRDPAVPDYNRASRKKRTDMTSAQAVLDARGDHPPHRTRVLFYHQFD